MNIRTILVPVDFSTCSQLVCGQAGSLAARLGAQVVVLHVAELPSGLKPGTTLHPDGGDRKAGDLVVDDARARLAPYVADAAAHGAPVEARVALGPVVATILAEVTASQADLVVIGTHGRTGLARVVLGSVAEAVAHQSKAPVMLIRREVRPECGRESCDWCPKSGQSPAEAAAAEEANG